MMRARNLAAIISIALATLHAATGSAATIRVPADQPTIQAGIDATATGDTVLVAAGTYMGAGNRDLDFAGRDIVVRSEDGAATTTISCGGSQAEPHRGFTIHGGETAAARVEGFTITGGYHLGGGMLIDRASPTIVDCIFRDNLVVNDNGGGIACTNDAAPTIQGCTFLTNRGFEGGGIHAQDSSPTLIECTFTENISTRGGGIYASGATILAIECSFTNFAESGGGIWCTGSTLNLDDCSFIDNAAGTLGDSWGGGIAAFFSVVSLSGCELRGNAVTAANNDAFARGGGLFGDTFVIDQCTFENNTAQLGGGAFIVTGSVANSTFTGNNATTGGGVYCSGLSSFTGCTFQGNQAALGGGMAVDATTPTVELCVFEENTTAATAPRAGAGLACLNGASPRVRRCTFYANAAGDVNGGTVFADGTASPTIENTIIAFSTGGEAAFCGGPAQITLICCDVYGNAGGDWVGCIADQAGTVGNISADPLFCTDSLAVAENSPCAPAQSICGTIGAFEAGCTPSAIVPTTWGAVKAVFRGTTP